MGNVEKWVVLGVLGLIVGILVISLNVDDPLKKDKVVLAGNSEKAETPKVDPGVPPAAKDLAPATTAPILNASIDTSSPAAPPAPAAIPSGSILKTMDGLQESYMTDAMFYTWKAGDTFTGLAQRFYGDPSRLAILKRINEGRTDVQPGERVLVPVYDLDAVPAAAPAPTVANPKTKPDAAKGAETQAPTASGTSSPRYHVVKDGESLWKIAKQELGSGARWNDIYNANRDVLSSPEALHTGQKLRVP
jgi:nucleoid-associated protein YgaU